MTATAVLVHGGASGAWTWHLVVERLAIRGIACLAPDLPSCVAPDNSVGLAEDAEHVRSLCRQTEGSLVLVANSYGGYVISAAAVDEPRVRRLVYVAALMPTEGEPLLDTIGGATFGSDDLGLSFLDDGRIVFDVEQDLASSYQLAPPEEIDRIRSHLGRPMSLGRDPNVALDRVAWRTIPSTYVVCGEDRALRPDAQRTWAHERATESVELSSDHCPQHSQPDVLADILERLVRD